MLHAGGRGMDGWIINFVLIIGGRGALAIVMVPPAAVAAEDFPWEHGHTR